MNSHTNSTELAERARQLGLWGLVAHWDDIEDTPWLSDIIEWEEQERQQRSLERRIGNSRVGRFKPLADFDWHWPEQIDRQQIEELYKLSFIKEAVNPIFIGPNGIGKSMIAKNIAHRAALKGHTVLFTTAAQMLGDLVTQETSTALQRHLTRYCRPSLLAIDSCEVPGNV